MALQENGRGGRASDSAARLAVAMCRKIGIEVYGFFVVGLLHDTERGTAKLIELGRSLPIDVLKVSICAPFSGTSSYSELASRGLIVNHDWSKHNAYNPRTMYRHPTLSWAAIEWYHWLAYWKRVLWDPSRVE